MTRAQRWGAIGVAIGLLAAAVIVLRCRASPVATDSTPAVAPPVETPAVADAAIDSDAPDAADVADAARRPPIPNTRSPVPDAEVQAKVMSTRADIRASCWDDAKGRSGETAAQATLALTIDGEGRVTQASVSGAAAFPTLGPCLSARARTWSFSRGHSVTKASASYNFKTD